MTTPLTGPLSLSTTNSFIAASVLVAATLLLARRAGWLNMVLLLGFGWELQTSHAALHGPIAFALLIVASGWMWWIRRRRGHAAKFA